MGGAKIEYSKMGRGEGGGNGREMRWEWDGGREGMREGWGTVI
jgi:hypothetical protein